MKEQTVSISPLAYIKMILHAHRNPTYQIHGVLLGNFESSSSSSSSSSVTPILTVADVIPICHEAPTKPILDMSLRIVDAYCQYCNTSSSSSSSQSPDDETTINKTKQKQQIVGWYTSPERLDDDKPGQAALRIMSNIGSRLSSGTSTTTTTTTTESPSSSGTTTATNVGGGGGGVVVVESPLPPHAEPVLCLVHNLGLTNLLSDAPLLLPTTTAAAAAAAATTTNDKNDDANTDIPLANPKKNALRIFGRDGRKHWTRALSTDKIRTTDIAGGGGGDTAAVTGGNWRKPIELARKACHAVPSEKLPLFDFVDHLENRDCDDHDDNNGDGHSKRRCDYDWLLNGAVANFCNKEIREGWGE